MKSKPFLLAVAAFALTASGVQAFGNTQMLQRAGLSQAQISAFEVARERRQAGDYDGARDVLVEAGVDEDVLQSVHKAARANREGAHQARNPGDYEADFKTFAEARAPKARGGMMGHHGRGMKMGHMLQDLTPDQREALLVAHQANDKEAVQAILKEVDIEMPQKPRR